ncbi:GUN4 domain-containing protein [Almyronema epifaneia]|uniref:GUN4 domain-containing protein n=1 Tax=Almyronema epifaneia S1 TaxID=2991925 RepID=A0ABW6IH49_9CYAN
MSGNSVSLFISYSRKDEAYMQELISHLEPLHRSGLISSWHDGRILPGDEDEWEPQIKANLEQAQVILLLISKDFLNSDYCYEVELTNAIARHKAGTACVIPVILRSCLWNHVFIGNLPLSELQALPKDAKPVNQWRDSDEAFTNIAGSVLEKIQQLQSQLKQKLRVRAEHQQQQIYPSESLPVQSAIEQTKNEILLGTDRVYACLQRLLDSENWEEADAETARLMIRFSGDESETQFVYENIEEFPCEILCKIDDLWMKFSNRRYGFTVQQEIWSRAKRKFDIFSDRVGWRKDEVWLKESELQYEPNAPYGHLPSLNWIHIEGWAVGNENVGHKLYRLLERYSSCMLLNNSSERSNKAKKAIPNRNRRKAKGFQI